MFSLGTLSFGMLSCDLCFHWNALISCLNDVSLFDAFPYYDVIFLVGVYIAFGLACYISYSYDVITL